MELHERRDELQAQGLGVAAISYDSVEVLAAFAERKGISSGLALLADDDSAVIRAFGIYNHIAEAGVGPNAEDPDVKAAVEQYVSVFGANPMIVGTPFPGTFIVDRQGRVTSRFFEEFYRERNTAANIMLKLGTPISGIAGSSGETAHLDITASQSNPDITVGSRFHLALDIAPKPEIHVYAPGAEEMGYRVIKLALDMPPFLRPLGAEYPASEIYHFEPLDERVPVYQKPFQLIQEIVVEGDPESTAALAELDAITLTGRLDYQACDDEICFNPTSVPLTWTIAVAPLDRQRALPVERAVSEPRNCGIGLKRADLDADARGETSQPAVVGASRADQAIASAAADADPVSQIEVHRSLGFRHEELLAIAKPAA